MNFVKITLYDFLDFAPMWDVGKIGNFHCSQYRRKSEVFPSGFRQPNVSSFRGKSIQIERCCICWCPLLLTFFGVCSSRKSVVFGPAFYSQQRPFCGKWRSKNGLRMLSMAKRLGSMFPNSPLLCRKTRHFLVWIVSGSSALGR